jgi:WD40 repeat protein
MVELKRVARGLVVLCAAFAAGTAAADEIFSKTALWEDGRTVGAVAISADGSRVAFAFDESNARVRSTEDETATIADLAWQGGDAYFAVFSADGGRLVMGTVDGMVRVWDVASARELASIKLPMPGAVRAAFSPDGTRIVTAGADGAARVWEADNGRALDVLAGHTKEVQDAVFSADGSMIATASRDNTVRIWNAADGSARAVLGHKDEVNSVAFSPDGRRVVSGSDDGAAHVFDLASGGEITTLAAGGAEVTDARFSPDGARIVTGSDDQIVRVWNAADGKPLAILPGTSAQSGRCCSALMARASSARPTTRPAASGPGCRRPACPMAWPACGIRISAMRRRRRRSWRAKCALVCRCRSERTDSSFPSRDGRPNRRRRRCICAARRT